MQWHERAVTTAASPTDLKAETDKMYALGKACCLSIHTPRHPAMRAPRNRVIAPRSFKPWHMLPVPTVLCCLAGFPTLTRSRRCAAQPSPRPPSVRAAPRTPLGTPRTPCLLVLQWLACATSQLLMCAGSRYMASPSTDGAGTPTVAPTLQVRKGVLCASTL